MNTISSAVKQKLEYLSKLPETEYPFISLYMNIHSHELFEQAEKNRIFLKNHLKESEKIIKTENPRDKFESFKNDEKKIMDYLENNLDDRAHGLAIFACDKLGVFECFQSFMPFDNSFVINSFPHLMQLTYQASEYKNTLVVMTDSEFSRIFEIKLGGFIIKETDIKNMVHRFHKAGGWSQLRYQRHIGSQVHHHYKEVANVITELLDKENYEIVILIGQEDEVKLFQLDLPKRVNLKVIQTNHIQMKENIDEIMKVIVNNLRKEEGKRKFKLIKDIIDKASSGDNKCLLMQDTINAANQGKIMTLAAVKNRAYTGWKCDGCLYTKKDDSAGYCPECKKDMRQTDLAEEAVRLTLKNDGTVEIAENEAAAELEKYEGIAAYLRY